MTSNAQVMTVANEGLIVFASARGEDLYCECSYQIYAMNPDGSNVQQLTDPGLFPYGAWNPVLSPRDTAGELRPNRLRQKRA
jgi:hypothetical protein